MMISETTFVWRASRWSASWANLWSKLFIHAHVMVRVHLVYSGSLALAFHLLLKTPRQRPALSLLLFLNMLVILVQFLNMREDPLLSSELIVVRPNTLMLNSTHSLMSSSAGAWWTITRLGPLTFSMLSELKQVIVADNLMACLHRYLLLRIDRVHLLLMLKVIVAGAHFIIFCCHDLFIKENVLRGVTLAFFDKYVFWCDIASILQLRLVLQFLEDIKLVYLIFSNKLIEELFKSLHIIFILIVNCWRTISICKRFRKHLLFLSKISSILLKKLSQSLILRRPTTALKIILRHKLYSIGSSHSLMTCSITAALTHLVFKIRITVLSLAE